LIVIIVSFLNFNYSDTACSNFLEGYGHRVQKSDFECFMSLDEMRVLFQKINKQVKPQEDSIRFYWISEEAVSRVLVIGSPPPEKPPNAYIL
jgi:CRISPR-associated protein Cas2